MSTIKSCVSLLLAQGYLQPTENHGGSPKHTPAHGKINIIKHYQDKQLIKESLIQITLTHQESFAAVIHAKPQLLQSSQL